MLPTSSLGSRKRQRVGSSSRLSAYLDPDRTLPEDHLPPPPSIAGGFNDPDTSDVLLRLHIEPQTPSPPDSDPDHPIPTTVDLHLHSAALRRSRYFDALLSDRWNHPSAHLTLNVPSGRRPYDAYISVLRLFYPDESFSAAILSVPEALEVLRVALVLLFDDCIRFCIRFLEAVPWTEHEEESVLKVIPLLPPEECRYLLARLSPDPSSPDLSEEMLRDLIESAVNSHPKVAAVKALVAKLLRDYPSRDSVQRVLNRAFLLSLDQVKGLLGDYSSPDLRVSGNSNDDEAEAIQRLKLHTVMVNARHLLWLVERMIELRVADTAAREWSEQDGLTVDLQKTFRDDGWKNIAPGLPSLVMRCTSRIANAVAAGSILVSQQVRMKLVKDWLPVLNVCRDIVSPISCHKSLYEELEETFLSIISTLPISDARELLQQCLSFSTRNVDDCPHLISAFNTWFRRANRPSSHDHNST